MLFVAFESRHIGNRKRGGGTLIRIMLMAAILIAFVLMMRKVASFKDDASSIDHSPVEGGLHYWPESSEPVIQHSTFTLSYDEENEQAHWVAYILTRDELNRNFVDRTDWFEEDVAVPGGSSDYYDYKGSGYTRGHLVPSADRAWSRKVNEETFLMSNISPQTYHFNGGIWRELEENVRDWARSNERLFIVTGPVIGDSRETIGHNDVTVPEAFFKVVLDLDQPEQKAIGFLIPNDISDQPLSEYARTVDDIEEITGINFFDLLVADDSEEDQVESTKDIDLWPVDPDRYRQRLEHWNQ